MILILSIYFVLSLFAGTLWTLKRFKNENEDKNEDKDKQNSLVILTIIEVLVLVLLVGILYTSDFKDSAWLAPIASGIALLCLAIATVICIGFVLIYRKNMIRGFLSENGLILVSYSIISAILIFFVFLIITGVLYATIDGFRIKGFSNFVGLAGIITTLLGILVTLWQLLDSKK